MAEPFKERIDAALVRVLGRHLQRVAPEFPRRRFAARAVAGLAPLELKARVAHVADALAACLPADFAAAAEVLELSLAAARDDDDLKALVTGDDGLAGWAVWPMTDFVARYGLAHPRRSLRALHALTQRHTAEYAIRPFLIEHRALTMATLVRWLDDPSPHVRRLVSEGTRPRLPWGMQLRHLVEDPRPCLPLLERLQDDPSGYVRRSVANHLNDVSKDHPELVIRWLREHLPGASPRRAAALRHAARALVKEGDKRALQALGLGARLRGSASFAISPARARVGEAVQLTVSLTSASARVQPLVVDYVVHHVKQGGATRAKTWKGWKLRLAAGERRALRKTHALWPVTTRRDHPGRHRVELLVNGDVLAASSFELLP
jgi:3-methyladenine DNA glycosylase AlkC